MDNTKGVSTTNNTPLPPEKQEAPLSYCKKLIDNWKELGLKPREIRFCAEYVSNGHNGTQAMLSVSFDGRYTYNSAAVEASKWLKTPKIQQAVTRWFERWLDEKKEKMEKEIIDVYYRRAFYPLDVFFDANRKPLPLNKIPREWHCCIDGIEDRYYGKDADVKATVMKLANREKALDTLGKYMTMFKEVSVHEHRITQETADKLGSIFSQEPRNVTPGPDEGGTFPRVSNE
jgi:hypothetical protein